MQCVFLNKKGREKSHSSPSSKTHLLHRAKMCQYHSMYRTPRQYSFKHDAQTCWDFQPQRWKVTLLMGSITIFNKCIRYQWEERCSVHHLFYFCVPLLCSQCGLLGATPQVWQHTQKWTHSTNSTLLNWTNHVHSTSAAEWLLKSDEFQKNHFAIWDFQTGYIR